MIEFDTIVNRTKNEPVFTIGVLSKILEISPETLRLYEREGLVITYRTKTGRRMYSQADIQWISCIRRQLVEHHLNMSGIKRLLALIPCWEVNQCKMNEHSNCQAFTENKIMCWQLQDTPCRCENNDCYTCRVYRMAPKIENIKQEFKISIHADQ